MLLSNSRNSKLVALIWIVGWFAFVAARLPADELESLSAVARKLGKSEWNIDVDPCSGQPPWWINSTGNGVICDSNCTLNLNATNCHVTRIILKSLSLNGSLPRELIGLPFLQDIDLSRNYLNGTIPPLWGSMQSLRIISLVGNRLTGPIPKELANITTLEQLVLEANQFTGTIPSEFGDLTRLRRLLLASNNLTGALPASLAKLTTLTEFRISDNKFEGSIPNFIQNWINIERIEIQASGLSGPIPNLTSLTKLDDLRISDLNGSPTDFPNLNASTSWNKVILRSCNIEGVIPPFIGRMSIEDELDLSFNKLTGPLPPNLGSQEGHIYLTGNLLNGTVPDQMKTKGIIDLSYNNFTIERSDEYCTATSPNLFANSKQNNTTADTNLYCVSSSCHSDEYHSFHINCGSSEMIGDYEPDGPESSNFFKSRSSNWGFSSTGAFLNSEAYGESLLVSSNNFNTTVANSELYRDARLSPLSLTYFGFCLRNGNYTVDLYFAEIMFSNDTTFRSLGRRIFDVYIQGILVKKDYNIANAAGGVFKAHVESFPAVVDDHTLEIRLYWAGKGTTVIPERSVYGPLISAISVTHDNYRPGKGISTGVIVGIVMAVIFGVILVVGILWWKGCLGRKHSMHNDLKGLDLHTGSFTLKQLKAATNNFDPANKIGEGGFGPVFKGVLLDGTIIAVKQLSSKSEQGNREFVNEIGMISPIQHPHLVKLYGYCNEDNQLLLVYEYLENNNLARALFGPKEYQLHLDWATRQKISVGIARGLAYLHEESRLKIVHRDIKATNVLLDGNLVPKISDFGLAKLKEEGNAHISTRVAGTFGYMAPEYAMRGHLTDKADVYSFGVVLLEIVSGRSNSFIGPKGERFYLLDWANSLKVEGKLIELVDPRLETKVNKKEAIRAIKIALLCTNAEDEGRPSMSTVVRMLEGRQGVGEMVSEVDQKTKTEEVEMAALDGDAPWTGSSASVDQVDDL